jgi:hypothetical protein
VFCFQYTGAGRGSRTPKTRRSADFESAASASSAIPAEIAVLQRNQLNGCLGALQPAQADRTPRGFISASAAVASARAVVGSHCTAIDAAVRLLIRSRANHSPHIFNNRKGGRGCHRSVRSTHARSCHGEVHSCLMSLVRIAAEQ